MHDGIELLGESIQIDVDYDSDVIKVDIKL